MILIFSNLQVVKIFINEKKMERHIGILSSSGLVQ